MSRPPVVSPRTSHLNLVHPDSEGGPSDESRSGNSQSKEERLYLDGDRREGFRHVDRSRSLQKRLP